MKKSYINIQKVASIVTAAHLQKENIWEPSTSVADVITREQGRLVSRHWQSQSCFELIVQLFEKKTL